MFSIKSVTFLPQYAQSMFTEITTEFTYCMSSSTLLRPSLVVD